MAKTPQRKSKITAKLSVVKDEETVSVDTTDATSELNIIDGPNIFSAQEKYDRLIEVAKNLKKSLASAESNETQLGPVFNRSIDLTPGGADIHFTWTDSPVYYEAFLLRLQADLREVIANGEISTALELVDLLTLAYSVDISEPEVRDAK
jgi:hypothetical protein